MKRFILSLLLIVIVIGLTGCGGTAYYDYNVEPTPIKQGTAKYTLKDIKLTLSHGHGRNLENKTFKNEDELRKSFKMFINQELEKQSLKASSDNLELSDNFKLSVNINYTRVYNWGGNALNKPEFNYTVNVYDTSDKLLASFGTRAKSTTTYGTFGSFVVDTEIILFQRDAEDEPKDIELISKTLVKELSKLGN